MWNKESETIDLEKLKEKQIERLKATVERAYETVPFYKKSFEKAGVKPEDLKSLDDLAKFPFLTKKDMREAYPFGLFSEPMENIVRLHASSGTTGHPTVVGYTKNDIDIWSEVMARTLCAEGGSEKDIIQVAYGYGLFTGGLGAHYGAERAGMTVVPISSGNSKRQLMLLKDFNVNLIACTPSYALNLVDVAEEMGIDIKELPLRAGFFGAEPWSDSIRKEIEDNMNITALDIYGLSEIIGPGVSFECEAKEGMHINEDHFYPEIINPETGEVLPDGQEGELVLTTITKEAFPAFRYRTRDITKLNRDRCKCGRTLVRMDKVTGRTDDMLIIRGVNVFPSQIESVIMEIEEVEPHYLIIIDRDGALDKLEIQIEIRQNFFSDEIRKLDAIRDKIAKAVSETLNVSAKITLVEPKTIERSMGKAVRVVDRRTKG